METFLLWLGANAVKGSVVTLIVFFTILFFSRKIPPRYKYTFWYLAAIRFVMLPMFLASFSFFTLTSSLMPEDLTKELPVTEELNIEQETNIYPVSSVSNYSKPEKNWRVLIEENITVILFALWALGAFGLIALFIFRNIWGHSLTKGLVPVADENINAFIYECRKLVKINRKFVLHETELTGSPVLLGVFKPTLLIPKNLFDRLKAQELRYVILHELMHLKKHDILINWLFGIVCALQWFNPFVWYAFSRMKSDREEARDADVLALFNKNESKEYGGLILKLSTLCGSGANFSESVGIMEKNKKIKRRIRMIKNFRLMSRWNTLFAVVLIVGIGIFCLSEAISKEAVKTNSAKTIKTPILSSNKTPLKLIKQLKDKDPKVPEVNHKAAYIQEGRGWKGFRVGATRKELVAFMGKPDNPGETRYLKWKLKQNMHCLIDDYRGAFELRFDQGCQQILKNGIRIGTSMKEVEAQYGKPTSTENRGKAKKFIYLQKGILFWFYNNNVIQIVVFRPRALKKLNKAPKSLSKKAPTLSKNEKVVRLIKQLKDKDSRARAKAARALRKLRDERAFEPLVKALKDPDSNVRANAAWALGSLGNKRAFEPLIKTLKDKDISVRRHVAFALGPLGDKRAIEPLFRLFKDSEPSVRNCAAISLAQLGGKRAFEPALELLKDKNSNVRKTAINALGQLQDKRAIEPLKELLKTEKDSRVIKEIKVVLKKNLLKLRS
jgi:beta-lactamase regulating signal transducer with metallopeptidase domain